MRRRALLSAGALLFLAGCGPSPAHPLAAVTPAPTPTLAPIRLPADDAPHNVLTEWWYYTGHLQTENQVQYGFELVFFQGERQGAPVGYAGHFAITDLQRRQFHYAQKTATLEKPPSTFNLRIGDWQIRGVGGRDLLSASMTNYSIALDLTPIKPPALHGANGIISFGPAGDSYYYSDTRLVVTGDLVDHGVRQQVTGIAWKDRQWGNFLVGRGGWKWFSIQLADNSELMLFILRNADGSPGPVYGTYDAPNGTTEPIGTGDAAVEATGIWVSPATGVRYPSGWDVAVSSQHLKLTLKPVLKNQELDTRPTTGQVYWEGEVAVTGHHDGRAVVGQAYVELTGYAKPPR